jgi:hypothetical protein
MTCAIGVAKTYPTTARSEYANQELLRTTDSVAGTMQPMVKWWWACAQSREEMIQEAERVAAKKSKFSDRWDGRGYGADTELSFALTRTRIVGQQQQQQQYGQQQHPATTKYFGMDKSQQLQYQ